jgi:hypothetical protein
MVFDRLKKRFSKSESYDEIKEHILGDRFLSRDLLPPPKPPTERPSLLHEPIERPEPLRESKSEPILRRHERDLFHSDLFPREPESLSPPTLEPTHDFISSQRSERKIEHIEEQLAFIKEQLTAIKAQNEAINERLKNIERKLSGGY